MQTSELQEPKPSRRARGKNCHPNAKTITLKNRKKPKCHHSFGFDDDDFKQFTHEQKKTLFNERHSNQNQGGDNQRNNQNQGSDQRSSNWKKESQEEGSRTVRSLMSQLKDSGSLVSDITQQNDSPPAGLPSSIVRGCNSQDNESQNHGGQTK